MRRARRRPIYPPTKVTIYYSPDGKRAQLVLVPVLRVDGKDYGPGDRLPSGFLAADFVAACVFARTLPPDGGWLPRDSVPARRMATGWLAHVAPRRLRRQRKKG